MKRLRALFLCLTIVAGFPLDSVAAGPISEDAPVTVEIAAIARAVDMDPSRDRARFMSELTRLIYSATQRNPAVALLRNGTPATASPGPPTRVPVPLTSDLWSRAIFKRTVSSDQLIAAIVNDRGAALLCYALAALDDETLEFLSEHPDLLTEIYERHAPSFAAFGPTLHIRAGRVVPPGGDAAVPLWEGAVGERVDAPDLFLPALFSQHGGRLAYLYDTIAQLDAPNAAFALGLWMTDPGVRLARFIALSGICANSYRDWRLEALPFSKPLHDLATLLMRMRVEPSGAPAAPAERWFWAEVFGHDDLEAGSVTFENDSRDNRPVDAAWLAEATGGNDVFWRGDRIDQFAFGQRVFSNVPSGQRQDAVVAIRAFPRQRMLTLALERSGIRAAATYALVARRASQMSTGRASRVFWTLAQLQSSLAHILRMITVGTIDLPAGEALITSLCKVAVDDSGRYSGTMATWVEHELLPLLPRADSAERRVIAALAGPPAAASWPPVWWEGQAYRLDLASAERLRVESVRAKQVGYSLDLALDLRGVARTLASGGLTARAIHAAVATLSGLEDAHGARFAFQPDLRAPGVDEPRPAHETVAKAVEELSKVARGQDVRRAARIASALDDLVDVVLGDALLSLTYAAELGDPEGAATLARNVALRHDFGISRGDGEIRMRTIWAIPKQDYLPGVPWHVTGSLLGLDIALAPLSLRRTNLDRLPEAPRLPSHEREAFALGVALMNPRALRDGDRDAVAAAIARGRRRVAALAAGTERLDTLAEAIALDGWRRRAIRWMLVNEPERVPDMFSLVDLATLGGGAESAALDVWGTTALASLGCACTRLVSPRSWRLLSGRPQNAPMASGLADLNLRVALVLGELGLPAALTKAVLAAAALDFIEGVAPRDPDDWWTVVRAAQDVPRERIEDYVAAAAAADGPLVPDDPIDVPSAHLPQ